MATHTGSEGTVRVGASNAVLEIRSYSVEETADTVEDTSTGQGALVPGSEVNVRFYPEGTATADVYYTGQAIVTGKTITGSFDGMVESTITVQGTGALTSAAV